MQILILISDVGHCLQAADLSMAGKPAWRSANWSKCVPFAEEVSYPSEDCEEVCHAGTRFGVHWCWRSPVLRS